MWLLVVSKHPSSHHWLLLPCGLLCACLSSRKLRFFIYAKIPLWASLSSSLGLASILKVILGTIGPSLSFVSACILRESKLSIVAFWNPQVPQHRALQCALHQGALSVVVQSIHSIAGPLTGRVLGFYSHLRTRSPLLVFLVRQRLSNHPIFCSPFRSVIEFSVQFWITFL